MPATLRVRAIQARGTLYAARTTLRACATLFRTHDPAGVRDYVPRPRPCGRGRLRTMVRCMVRSVRVRLAPCVDHLPARVSARRSARASGARQVRWAGAHRDEPLPAAIQDAVAAAIEDGVTMDEIVSRPFARRRPFAFDPARTTLRACATRRGSLGRAHGRPDLPAARDRSLCRGMGADARAPRRGP